MPASGRYPRRKINSLRSHLVWYDPEVGEIPAGAVSHPQAHQPARAVAEPGDDQTGLLRIAHEHAHLRTRDHHARVEPGVRVRRGADGLLENSRPFGSQLLPGIVGMRDVLYGVAVSCRVVCPE